MPATESTWRSQPLLHRIFAITGLLMTLATIWMFYADHERTWKQYQVQTLDIDQTVNLMRQEQVASSAAFLTHEQYESELLAAEAAPIATALVDDYLAQLKAYYAHKKWSASSYTTREKSVLKELGNVNKAAEDAALARQSASTAGKPSRKNRATKTHTEPTRPAQRQKTPAPTPDRPEARFSTICATRPIKSASTKTRR
jgi:hypothetical protein